MEAAYLSFKVRTSEYNSTIGGTRPIGKRLLSEVSALRKRKVVTVLLSEDQFSRFTAFCDSKGYKKSTLIVRLIREYLDSEGAPATADAKSSQKRK
jgi:hypothetical protein